MCCIGRLCNDGFREPIVVSGLGLPDILRSGENADNQTEQTEILGHIVEEQYYRVESVRAESEKNGQADQTCIG